MKTISRPFTIVIVVAVALMASLTIRVYAKKPTWAEATHVLKIPKHRKYKDPKMDDAGFKALLDRNEAVYCIRVKKDGGDESELPANDCSGSLTSTASVDNATRELVLICGGARVTQRAGFNSAQQQANVDNALLPPSP